MARKGCECLSAELGGLADRLRAWRKGTTNGARIAEPIWEEAAATARAPRSVFRSFRRFGSRILARPRSLVSRSRSLFSASGAACQPARPQA